jgi:hypothetical protein
MRRAILFAAVALLILIAVPAIAAQDKRSDKPGETDPGPYRAHGFSVYTDAGYVDAGAGTYSYLYLESPYDSSQHFWCSAWGDEFTPPDISRQRTDKLVVSGSYAAADLNCYGSPPEIITFEFEIDPATVVRVHDSGSYRSQVLKGDTEEWDYKYHSQYLQGMDGTVSGRLFGKTIGQTYWSYWQYTTSHQWDPNGPPASPPGKPPRGAAGTFLGSPYGAGGVGAVAVLGLIGGMIFLSRALGRREQKELATHRA